MEGLAGALRCQERQCWSVFLGVWFHIVLYSLPGSGPTGLFSVTFSPRNHPWQSPPPALARPSRHTLGESTNLTLPSAGFPPNSQPIPPSFIQQICAEHQLRQTPAWVVTRPSSVLWRPARQGREVPQV